jgi:hypothetical protein
MIGKWMQELQEKGSICDYTIDYDDVTQKFLISYVENKPTLQYILEFTIDPITQQVVFKENTNEC